MFVILKRITPLHVLGESWYHYWENHCKEKSMVRQLWLFYTCWYWLSNIDIPVILTENHHGKIIIMPGYDCIWCVILMWLKHILQNLTCTFKIYGLLEVVCIHTRLHYICIGKLCSKPNQPKKIKMFILRLIKNCWILFPQTLY